jgi:outer membrane protein TolC
MRLESIHGPGRRWIRRLAGALAASLALTATASAQTPAPAEPLPAAPAPASPAPASPAPAAPAPAQILARDAAVHFALQHNPLLRTVRSQRGFAEAAIVIAQTYPFNPVYTGYVSGASGPASAGITNVVYQEHYVTLELELCGQGGHRREAAAATASRIEWEICQQELAVSIAVIRACNAVLYRTKKLGMLDELIRINEAGVEQLRQQVDTGKAKATDLLLARIDLDALKAQRGQVQTALTIARSDLRRQLGTLDDSFLVTGDLDVSMPSTNPTSLTQLALDQRPDLKGRRAAAAEVAANERLVESNRHGNPSIGPYFQYDPLQISYWGVRVNFPIPVINKKEGEIMRARADVNQVHLGVMQLEQQVSQDVLAALGRLADTGKWAHEYSDEVLPRLAQARQELEAKFAANDAGVSLANVLTIQRGHLKAMETLLDARYEVSLAEADLALAAAEPALALGPPPPAQMPAPMQMPMQMPARMPPAR